MKNIEKYTNTKDALEAYNSLASKPVSFYTWLECEFEEPRVPTLLEAAQEMTRTWESQWQYGHLSIVEKSVRNLSRAIERETRKPVRNLDKYKTANEATKGFREMCNRIQACRYCRFRHVNCAIAWLYEKAGNEEEK